MPDEKIAKPRFRSVVTSAPLLVERQPDGNRKLMRDLEVEVRLHGRIVKIKVPTGFVTDYSSIPTPLHGFVRWSRVDIAGVVHDWLYWKCGVISKRKKVRLTRTEADTIWRRIALSGCRPAHGWQAVLCWFAIRGAGTSTWNGYAKRRELARESYSKLTLPFVVFVLIVFGILLNLASRLHDWIFSYVNPTWAWLVDCFFTALAAIPK